MPYFSIIIPTLNEEVNLPILLDSLAKQTFRDFEVIISDGKSEDRTKEIALTFQEELPALIFFENNVRNVGAARNEGALKASGEYLIFFDSDVHAEAVFLEKIRMHIDKTHLEMLTVWNRADHHKLAGNLILGILDISMSIFQKVKPSANGPCMILKREIFEKIKGFDPTIVFGEDFELIQRAWKTGASFGVFPTPILYVSTRRFEKEGFITSMSKSIKAVIHQLISGPIRKPIFDYEMGGQYYKSPNHAEINAEKR